VTLLMRPLEVWVQETNLQVEFPFPTRGRVVLGGVGGTDVRKSTSGRSFSVAINTHFRILSGTFHFP
jgi:hypothetical protein